MTLLVGSSVGFVATAMSMLLSVVLRRYLSTHVGHAIMVLSPCVFVLCLKDALGHILVGTGRTLSLAALTAIPPLAYCFGLWAVARSTRLTIEVVLLLQYAPLFLTIAMLVSRLTFRLDSLRPWFKRLGTEQKAYGFPLYSAAILTVGCAQLGRLSLSYWLDAKAMGFFSLATSLAEPVKLPVNSLATVCFPRFANSEVIPKNALRIALLLGAVSFGAGVVLYGEPLKWAYGHEFSCVGNLARFVAVGAVVHSIGELYNRFLAAHGKGNAIRGAVVRVGLLNVVGLTVLIPLLGLWGAACCATGVSISYCLLMRRAYQRTVKTIVDTSNHQLDCEKQ